MTITNTFFASTMKRIITSGFRYISLLFVVCSILAFSTLDVLSQTTIVRWTFPTVGSRVADNTSLPVNQSKEISVIGSTGYTYPVGATTQSISATNWVSGSGTFYWQIELNTIGYDNLTISSKQRSSNTGPRDFRVEFSLTGSDPWTPVTGTNVTAADNFTSGILTNVALPSVLDNQSAVYLRWIMTSNTSVVGSTIGSSGTSRIDDIAIIGLPTSGKPTVNISTANLPSIDINQDSYNNLIYQIDLAVSDANAVFNGMTITPDGTYNISDFYTSGISIWHSDDQSFDPLIDTQLESVNIVASGNSVTFNSFTPLTFLNGSSHSLFISADVSDLASIGNQINISTIAFADLLFNGPPNFIGTDPLAVGSTFSIAGCVDEDSDVLGAATQPSGSIASISNDIANAVNVFEFFIFDIGTCDGLPTIVTNIRFRRNISNEIDWSDNVAGVRVDNIIGTDNNIANAATINDDYITIPITEGNLSIADGGYANIRISVFLNNTNTFADGDIFSLYIDSADPGFTTGSNSSKLNFSSDIFSSDFTIDVSATEMRFLSGGQPVDTDVNLVMATDIQVEATDANGNRDLEYTTDIILASSGTMTGIPMGSTITVTPSLGLAEWRSSDPTEQIVHTVAGNALNLLTTSAGIPSPAGDAISTPFNIIQTADHLTFVGVPSFGQEGVTISSFSVEARLPNENPDTNYAGTITIDATPGGSISGTLTQTVVNGVATFNDISFTNSGNYSLSAASGLLVEDVSPGIAIVGSNVSLLPNGVETMTDILPENDPATIATHDANGDFDNSGLVTFSGGGITNEGDVMGNASSSGYAGASGGANIRFLAGGGDRGFAIEDIDASAYTDITLQFAVRKQNDAPEDFATLSVDFWDGDSWEPITISDFPVTADPRGWYPISPVVLPATAQISNLGIRFTKSGSIACRIDDISLTGTPNAASNLVFANINGGLPPTLNIPFDVDIEVKDGSGQPANVLEDTDVELVLQTGSGSLGGTLTGTILSGANTSTISGVTYNVSEAGVILTAQRTAGDNLSNGNSSGFNVIASEPVLSATNFVVGIRGLNSIQVSWDIGDGVERIVVAKQGSAVDLDPVDGSDYSANADISQGEDIGNGNIVVYAGTGTSVTVTNLLSNNTEYHFAVYEYNGVLAGLKNYKQLNPAVGNALTICDAPLTQASNITITNVESNSMSIGWDVGDGNGQVVVMNSINSFTTPSSPPGSANPVWQNSGQQVVFVGDGTTADVDISGLSGATEYWIRVYEYNCTGADIVYNIVDNTVSEKTRLLYQDFTSCPPSGWLNVRISGDQDWTCGGGYATASGLGSSASSEIWYVSPAVNLNLLANEKLSFDTWTSGTDDTHPKLEVLYSTEYSGSGNPNIVAWNSLAFSIPGEDSQTWTSSGQIDLSQIVDNNTYVAFKYVSSGITTGAATEWRIDNVEILDNVCAAPSQEATNLSYSNLNQNSMTLNWDSGNGVGRLVVAGLNPTFTFTPLNGTEYAANSDYSQGADLGNGDKVVFSGNTNSFDLSGLTESTDYYFQVYEYNCDNINRVYSVSPLTGSQSTLDPGASDIIATVGYSYPENFDYSLYQATGLTITTANSLEVFGLTLRDGGASANSDGLSTTLTSISFATNGSTAIRAAALYYGGSFIGTAYVNGSTNDFSFDISLTPIVAGDQLSEDFELYVTYMAGDFILDNEQIVFTVTEATADPTGTLFILPDGGAAQSISAPSGTGDENVIKVEADDVRFVQVPRYSIPIDEEFTIEAEASDALRSRDLDKNLTITKILGVGTLSAVSGLSKPTSDSTVVWNDLIYDTEEDTRFRVSADENPTILRATTQILAAKPRMTIYTFTGATGSEATYPADKQPTNGSISDISRGANLIPVNRADAFSARNWPTGGIDTNGSYYEFTVTAAFGYSFNISSIEFDHRRSSTGPLDWQIRNSTDGFTSNLGSSMADVTTWTRNETVNLTITSESTVTFRLYAFNAEGGNGNWALDNIEIFGDFYDSKPPLFISGYPQSDSARVDGFHLQASVDEPLTAYYLVKATGDAAPIDPDDVVNGVGGLTNGSIDIVVADSVYREIVFSPSLLVNSGYDVYWTLNDGANALVINASQTNVRTSDNLATVSAPVVQIPGITIEGTDDSMGEAVNVFSFMINDNSPVNDGDKGPTNVSKLWIRNAGATAIWTNTIAGVTLSGNSLGNIPILDTRISDDSLVIEIDPINLIISDQANEEITMAIYLQSSNIIDGSTLAFEIDNGSSGEEFKSSTYGSQFASPFVETVISSNTHTINVLADRLNIDSYTTDIPNNNQDLSLSVESVDANGNLDTDESSVVNILLGQFSQSGGSISADPDPPGLTKTLINGQISWDNIRYSQNNDFISLIANHISLTDDTTGIIEIGSPTDLIVTNTTTLSTNLTVNDVDIQAAGNLTISTGVVLTVQGNFNIDGILNGQSGTVDFDANGNTLQLITGSVAADFYNITISNTGNQGVRAETDINLHNSLKLNSNVIFDADGLFADMDFTLVSTPTYTARISEMGIDARLDGEVIWQRSLRTGPAGWRYIGTPIQGQILGNISDDVWIQGIAERAPNAWTNIAYISEPLGTDGENGFESWVDFTSNSNPVNTGVGMKLWLWDSDYITEQKISNKGVPNVGNGGDNLVEAGEEIVYNPSYTPTAYDGGGWNFYANPYPCEINWDNVAKTDLSGEAVYIWDPNGQNYRAYSSLTGPDSPEINEYVSSGQGFFVKATSGSAELKFSETSKSDQNGNSFFRIADEGMSKLMVQVISDNGKKDGTAVAFTNFATDEYEQNYDALKLSGGWVNLSSLTNDNKLLAINAMGENRGVQFVKLNISPYYFGNYTMKFPSIESFSEGAVIRLVDKYLDKTTYVSGGTNYVFKITENIPETYGSNRFELQFVQPISFRFENINTKAGQEFVVPVYADQLADVLRAQMALGWEKDELSFVGIEDAGEINISDFDLSNVEAGQLRLNSAYTEPKQLPDDTKLFSLRFKALNGKRQAQLRFEKNNMKITAINDIDMPFSSEDILIDILQNRFVAGAVATYSGVPVSGVLVNAIGDESIEKITDQLGDYDLETFEQSKYTISASKNDDLNFKDVVTTLDIIKSRRHMLQIEEFTSPYQYLAADVNDSKSITAIDLVQMRKVVLGIENGFSAGLNWLIIPKTYDLTDDPFNYKMTMDVTLEDQDIDLDFVGIKVGDVDNSWSNEAASRFAKGKLELSLEQLTMKDDYIEIPVITKDFSDISGYQFSITWDASQLEYAGLEHQSMEGFVNDKFVKDGFLSMMWYESEGNSVDLDNGSILFNLRFTSRDENAKSLVEINSKLTKSIAYDGKLNSLAIKSTAANVDLNELRNGKLELLQNVPNPFDYSTRFDFKINKPGRATFTIVNLLGEVVYLHEQMYDTGVYSLSWDRSQARGNLAPGIYLYRLECNGEEAVRKMMIE